jgi:hypothetical protein
MLPKFSLIILFTSLMTFAQQDPIVFDGRLGEDEWNKAQRFSIDYEIQPGNNSPAPHKMDVFVLYSTTHLYVGFDAKADMANLRSAVRNRDDAFQDDIVMFGVDTFGDGRYGISVGCNAEGSQVDTKFTGNVIQPHSPFFISWAITTINLTISLMPIVWMMRSCI